MEFVGHVGISLPQAVYRGRGWLGTPDMKRQAGLIQGRAAAAGHARLAVQATAQGPPSSTPPTQRRQLSAASSVHAGLGRDVLHLTGQRLHVHGAVVNLDLRWGGGGGEAWP